MHSFKDSLDRTWDVVIDFFTLEKLKARTGISLVPDFAKAVEAITADLPTFIHVLYILCHDQTEGKVSEREFFRGINTDTLAGARAAFREELIFFCPTEAKETLRHLFQVAEEITGKAVLLLDVPAKQAQALERIRQVDTDHLAALLAKEFQREISGEPSGGSLERSA